MIMVLWADRGMGKKRVIQCITSREDQAAIVVLTAVCAVSRERLQRRLQSVTRRNVLTPLFKTNRRNMHVLTQFVDQFKLHLAVEENRIRSLRHLIHDLRNGSGMHDAAGPAAAAGNEDRDGDEVRRLLNNAK